VAGWDGATDVSVVLAGLQWIVANRDRYDIRVLNLSFGTDSTQSYLQDPLNYAIERVWASDILVVSSAGNRGPSPGTVSKPGDDPFVLTVGAADVGLTAATSDDAVAEFSGRGPTRDGFTKPDLVAPGVTIVSNRALGSTIDVFRPAARVGQGYFKGTGTSQAAAIVSGIAALMFEASPALTPDVAKAALVGTANRSIASQAGAGAGLVDAAAAVNAAASGAYVRAPANGGLTASSGLGSLDASRGSFRVYADLDGDGSPEQVSGERDVLGKPWNPSAWWTGPWSAPLWSGKHWGGMTWEGKHWGSSSWSVAGWDGKHWGGKHWGVESWN
jgi:serine protease AprX